MEIVHLHRSKKEMFERVRDKHGLNLNNKQKYLKKKKKPEDIYNFRSEQQQKKQ